ALRELALLWLADKGDDGLQRYRTEHKITRAWEARGGVGVAPRGRPQGHTPAARAGTGGLAESVGASYHQVVGDDISEALLTFARAENATQLVLGASRRSWLTAMLTGPGISARTIRGSGDIDVHIVTHSHVGRRFGILPRYRGGLTRRRQIAGFC